MIKYQIVRHDYCKEHNVTVYTLYLGYDIAQIELVIGAAKELLRYPTGEDHKQGGDGWALLENANERVYVLRIGE